jgi:hypothetical protein
MRMICESTSSHKAFVPTKKRFQRNDADEPISRLHTEKYTIAGDQSVAHCVHACLTCMPRERQVLAAGF